MESDSPKFSLLLFAAFVCVAAAIAFMMVSRAVETKVQEYHEYKPTLITVDLRQKELECLAKNIYWEASGEPFEGKVAVAQVTLNRVESDLFPSDVCRVVYQKDKIRDRVVCQFSWFCERNHLFNPIRPRDYEEAQKVARKVLLENFRLPGLENALFYHADYVNPRWRKTKIVKIGRHIFYER